MPDRRTITEKGLGAAHRRVRARLMVAHIDGAPCPCLASGDCGPGCPCRKAGRALPMYRDPALNPDGLPLHADHSLARSQGGTRADRLMLATCNQSRGDGTRGDRTASDWWSRDWSGNPQVSALTPRSLAVRLTDEAKNTDHPRW